MESKVMQASPGKVLVTNLDRGEQVSEAGIILRDDDGTVRGVHARWGQVYSVGEDITDLKEGEWILVVHGRWSRTIEVNGVELNLVDYPENVLIAGPTRPKDLFVGY